MEEFKSIPDSEPLLLTGELETCTNERLRDMTRNHIFYSYRVTIIVVIGLLSVLGGVTLGIGIGRLNRKPVVEDYTIWKDCGSSAAEARSRDCIFDIMMTGWVKKDCYHEELSEQYIRDGNFKFFYDQAGTREMPLDTVRLGEHHHMYTNDLHHRAHCVYVWKLQALALESQGNGKVQRISNESMSYDHTVHCARILVNSVPTPPYSMNYGEVDFLTCGPYLS